MTDIKELAVRVAQESHWYYTNDVLGDESFIDFSQRLLAAYLAEQSPSDIGPKSQRAGWRMDVYAAPPLPQLAPQHEANDAHYALTRAVREMLPKFCKDPDKFKPLLRSEAAIQRLIEESLK